jgi:hypothetical protein
MKKILLLLPILLLVISTASFAKGKDKDYIEVLSPDGVYEEVIQIDNVSQAELFNRAKKWILQNMITGDNNIMFDDKEFTINNNGSLKIDPKSTFMWVIKSGVTNFKFHVWLKEGKYKFRIDNVSAYIILHANNAVAPHILLYNELESSKQGPHVKAQANDRMVAFIAAFKRGMATSAKQQDNNW